MEEVEVEGLTIKEVAMLRQKVYDLMDEGLRKYRRYTSIMSNV